MERLSLLSPKSCAPIYGVTAFLPSKAAFQSAEKDTRHGAARHLPQPTKKHNDKYL